MYLLWLLEEARHLDVVRSGYLDLAYVAWLQCRFELKRPIEVVLGSGSWMEKQILMKPGLSSFYLCCVLLMGPGNGGSWVFRIVEISICLWLK